MSNPNTLNFTREDIIRVKQLVKEGVLVQTEMKTLREGLSETVKAIAEELEVKPALLNKAIRIAFKDSLHEERRNLDDIEYILDIYQQSLKP